MAKGISIHIGLNRVDPDCYGGWAGTLSGCINDARDMQSIAQSMGYSPTTLLTDDQATASEVVRCIGQAAQRCAAGDILLLTYSGHGGQVADVNGDEGDGQDETWVLFDRMLVDDELYQMWTQFQAGVRILVISDSCHSGTVARMMLYDTATRQGPLEEQYRKARGQRSRAAGQSEYRLISEDAQIASIMRNAPIYDSVQWLSGRGDRATMGASVMLISGCLDNQLSLDGARNGLFTQTLLGVWNNGAFRGNYDGFWRAILQQMPPTQSPNLFKVGPSDPVFEAQQPFTIGVTDTTSTPSSTTRPTMDPVNTSVPVNGGPPRFRINPGPNRYYAVEFATRPELFDYTANNSQRSDATFYASWKTKPYPRASSYPADYELPADVWQRLKNAGAQLFYRIWCTESPTAWVNAHSSIRDSEAVTAPSIRITPATVSTEAGSPSIVPSATSVPNGATPPRFIVDPGPGRYYAVEITTRANLFNNAVNGSQRTDDNFFMTWRVKPYLSAPAYPATFDLPVAAWDRLRRNSTQLYYRLWATDSPDQWVNARATTRDSMADSAPSIQLMVREREMEHAY
jgi:metacaspase-1